MKQFISTEKHKVVQLMDYQGIVITGTRAAGKSTIAKEICRIFPVYQIAKAVTTRPQREDNGTEDYEYVSKSTFDGMNDLLIKTEYNENLYGIKESTIKEIIEVKKTPLLIITPQEASKFNDFSPTKRRFMTFFLDASDSLLENRMKNRNTEITENTRTQRIQDRNEADKCSYKIINEKEKKDVVELILSLWEHRNTGGMLPKRIIELMIKCGMLLEKADLTKVKSASYDLKLGEEYYQGEIKRLDDTHPFIKMDPGDYAVVSSREIANFPRDVAARFDLTVSLFCKGIILSNGPQVDPGFKGGLFCLLFNTSNEKVELKLDQHYFTIEFVKLIEPTEPYKGKYQDQTNIMNYLPSTADKSAVRSLQEDINELKTAKWYEKTLPLILSVFSIITTIVFGFIVYFKT